MKTSHPIQLTFAACFALFALCVYILQPDSQVPTPTTAPSLATSPAVTPVIEAATDYEPQPASDLQQPPSAVTAKALPPVEVQTAAARLQKIATENREPQSEPRTSEAPISQDRLTAQGQAMFAAVSATQPSPSNPSALEPAAVAMPAALPAAFIEPSASQPLTPEQRESVKSLQKEFIQAVGGPNQNPNDPKYLDRWRAAQSASDQQFKALFGVQAFLERERLVNMAGNGRGSSGQ